MSNKIKNFWKDLFSNFTPEKSQKAKLIAIAFLIITILFLIVNATSKKEKRVKKINKKNLYNLSIIPKDLEQDIKRHSLVYKVKMLQSNQYQIEKHVKKIEETVNKIQNSLKKIAKLSSNIQKLNEKYSFINKNIKQNKRKIEDILNTAKPRKNDIKKLINDNRTFKQRIKSNKEKRYYTPINNPETLKIPIPEQKNQHKVNDVANQKKPKVNNMKISKIHVFKEKTDNIDKFEIKKITKKVKIKLAAGSFIQGVLLTGLDAPTAGSAQANPVPVLIKVEKEAIMPNKFRMNIKGCFIIGAGYGDLSTERAMIKTETLSCITQDGKTIDVGLRGHIVDMDGKIGLRGRLVSRSGQILAKSLLAGFLAGISKIFTPQYIPSISVEPNSNALFQTPRMSDVFMSGSLSGASNALKKIADYYIKVANKIFPVVEIQAGRPVEIIVLKTQTLITRKKEIEAFLPKTSKNTKKENRRN